MVPTANIWDVLFVATIANVVIYWAMVLHAQLLPMNFLLFVSARCWVHLVTGGTTLFQAVPGSSSLFLILAFFSCFTVSLLYYFRVALCSRFNFFILLSFHVTLFFMFLFSRVALFSRCSVSAFHYFHNIVLFFTLQVVLSSCCTLFMLHCPAWTFSRTGFPQKTWKKLPLFQKRCNFEIYETNCRQIAHFCFANIL